MTNSEEPEVRKPRKITITVSSSDWTPIHLTGIGILTEYGPLTIPIDALMASGNTITYTDEYVIE